YIKQMTKPEGYSILKTAAKADKMQVLIGVLEDKGYQYKFRGRFGFVFTKPGLDYIIKISKDDPCYSMYVRYVLKNQRNPHLPKLRGKFISLAENILLVRIEKLDPLPMNEYINSGMHEFFEKDVYKRQTRNYNKY